MTRFSQEFSKTPRAIYMKVIISADNDKSTTWSTLNLWNVLTPFITCKINNFTYHYTVIVTTANNNECV